MAAILAHDVVAGSQARGDVAVFAHGILGSRSNWKGFARRFLELHPTYSCLLVDLRNHGESHGFAGPHTVQAAASDVDALLKHLEITPTILIGHSWGGKTMLALALREGCQAKRCVVVDAPPGIRTFGQPRPDGAPSSKAAAEVEYVVDVISTLPPGLARDRKDLVASLTARGLSNAIAQWMTTNLTPLDTPLPDGRAFRFKFDLPAVREMLADFGQLNLWPQIATHTGTPALLMVRGGRSDRWSPDERQHLEAAVKNGQMKDVVLDRAGHWVHTDDPEGLLSAIGDGLPRDP